LPPSLFSSHFPSPFTSCDEYLSHRRLFILANLLYLLYEPVALLLPPLLLLLLLFLGPSRQEVVN
jgi:hypothetical protein